MSKKFTGILTGKSNENRGSSRYSLEMSGKLTVDGQAIEVNLFGDYALTGGVAKGKFVITTGSSEDDLEEGMDWMEAEFEQLSFANAVFYSSGQGGLLKGYKRGGFELQIDLRKYGNMSDGWTITFG